MRAPAERACEGRLGTSRIISVNPQARPLHLGLKSYNETLKLRDHEVVLTFDDGPDPETTPPILDALRAECVRATFFLIGRYASQAPDLVQREIGEYHTVGFHSNTHPPITLRGLNSKSAKAEIDDGIEAVEKAGYGAAALPPDRPHVPFFRFPGFADTPELLRYLDDHKIAVFGTDLWASDWLDMSADYEWRHVIGLLEKSRRHSGIILFHDTRPSTAKMLPAFLEELKLRGYSVVHIAPAKRDSELGTPVTRAPASWTSETEKIISRAWPKIEAGSKNSLGERPRP